MLSKIHERPMSASTILFCSERKKENKPKDHASNIYQDLKNNLVRMVLSKKLLRNTGGGTKFFEHGNIV